MHLQVGVPGSFIAVVFVVLLALVFRWMFRVPRQLPYEVAQIRRTVNQLRTVVVPVVRALSSERAVELACRLAEPQQAHIVLVHVVEVPLSLPLDAAMPAQRQIGEESIDVGTTICETHELPCEGVVIPARSPWEGILRIARERHADLIVLGLDSKVRRPGEELSRNVAQVVRRAPCEVLVDRPAAAAIEPLATT